MATLLILAVSILGKAEAGIVTDKMPLQCYVDHKVTSYDVNSGQAVGWIDADVDLVQITGIGGNGVAIGTHPSGSRRVERLFWARDVFADANYANRNVHVNGSHQVYRTKSSSATIGSIANEDVTVVADNGNRAQIVYRLNNGTGYKMGWVPSSVVSSVSSRTPPGPVPNPLLNTAHLNDGWYRIQPLHDLGRSVDALGPQIGSGNNIHMWTSVDSALQQKFYLRNQGNGYFTLQSAYGSKLYVTADGRGPGANLYTAPQNNSDSQLFRVVDAGNNSYHVFARVGVNLNFDCAGGGRGDGNNVQLWTTENTDWHKWRFTPVSLDENWDNKIGQHLANENSEHYQKPINRFNKSYTSQRDGSYHPTNCTWYAWGRMREVTGKNLSVSGDAGNWHNSTNWDSNLTSKCVAERTTKNGGHVVFVEYVDNNRGRVYYTECNWNAKDDYKVQVMDINTFKSYFKWFIH